MFAFASTSRHRAERETSMKTMAIITSAAAGAVLLALGTGGTTLAFWVDGAPLSAGPISTGSLELTVDGHNTQLDLTNSLFQGMLPGDRRIQEVTVATTGTVITDLTVSGVVDPNAHEVRVAPGACPAELTVPALGVTPVLLGEWQPGVAQTVCIEVTLPLTTSNLSQGATTDFTIDFVATQVN